MHKHISYLILIVFLGLYSCSEGKKEYSVVFYNVENLFDTINQEEVWDDEFTPGSKLKYTTKRYHHKLANLAKVLSSVDTVNFPVLIGLCEVENRSVLDALIIEDKLKAGNYGIAHTESPDFRGIDCALLYQKENFHYLKHEAINIQFPWDEEYTTRDILYVTGVLNQTDTLHLFVNHWPSRRGGMEKSEKNRVFVAEQLKKSITKIQEKNAEAKIIIMGDFNDEPNNKSVKETLAATNDTNTTDSEGLYNLMYDLQENGKGSYLYRGTWNMLDNLVVSNSLLKQGNGFFTTHSSGEIYREKWICYKTPAGVYAPSRSYAGPKYYGGFSDHFPVLFKLSN